LYDDDDDDDNDNANDDDDDNNETITATTMTVIATKQIALGTHTKTIVCTIISHSKESYTDRKQKKTTS